MATKSINVKLPIGIGALMDDRGHLNPQYMTEFIVAITSSGSELPTTAIEGSTFNYSFKIDSKIHKTLKMKALEKDISLNEYLGRLVVAYYK